MGASIALLTLGLGFRLYSPRASSPSNPTILFPCNRFSLLRIGPVFGPSFTTLIARLALFSLDTLEKEKFDPPIFSKVEMKRFRFSLVQSSRTFCDTFSCEFDSKNFNIVFFIFGIFATIKRSFEEIWTR